MFRSRLVLGLTTAGMLAGVSLTACGSDPDVTAASNKSVDVVAVDYAYKELPAKAKAGTQFSLVNESAKELHEFVAIRLPDAEKRPIKELVKLPEAELGALLSPKPATVIIAQPKKGAEIMPVGDGTISEPGRYIVFCAIPTGAVPQEYLDAAAKANGQKPEGVAGGPPHFVNGMYGEITIS